MKLTILGKYGPFPKKGNTATSGYLVTQDNTNILLDMGAGTLTRILDVIDLSELDAIVISHLHFDHTSDLLPFRYLLEQVKKPITLYTQYLDTPYYHLLFDNSLFNIINITKESKVKIGNFDLSFYEMTHPVPTLATKIKGNKEFLYTADTSLNDTLLNISKTCDYILADCTKDNSFTGPHMTINDAITIKENSKAKIFATHLSPNYSPKKEFEKYNDIVVVEEMQTYNLD